MKIEITDQIEIKKTIAAFNGKFQSEDMLMYLLAEDVIFINNGWWYKEEGKEWPEDFVTLHVNCNDIFAWGCADSEDITHEELDSLFEMYRKDNIWGAAAWCIKKRKMMPQGPVEKQMKSAGYNLKELIGK